MCLAWQVEEVCVRVCAVHVRLSNRSCWEDAMYSK